jgi:hypothetical protein
MYEPLLITISIFMALALIYFGYQNYKLSQKECPKENVIYQVDRRSFKDEMENPTPVSIVFKRMFEEKPPR